MTPLEDMGSEELWADESSPAPAPPPLEVAGTASPVAAASVPPQAPAEAEAGASAPAARPPNPVRPPLLAVTFLTGIPLPVKGEVTPAELWRSMGWYPLVGLALGAAAWGVFSLLLVVLPGLVAAVLVILLLEVVTRGLHMDGLMDTADGILSGAPRERALEIMKDSHAGAMGVSAAILVIVLKVAALGSLSAADAAAPLLAGWAAARTLPALNVYLWPYARRAGTGEAFTRERSLGPVVLALGFLAVAFVAAGAAGLALGAAGSWWGGAAVAAVGMGCVLAVDVVVARRLGGLTGDVYGMGIQLAEAVALVVGCALVA